MAAYIDFVWRTDRAERHQRFEDDLDYDFEDAELRLPRETLRDRENPLEALTSPKFRLNSLMKKIVQPMKSFH